jgi:hypothetical protein
MYPILNLTHVLDILDTSSMGVTLLMSKEKEFKFKSSGFLIEGVGDKWFSMEEVLFVAVSFL